MPDSLEVRPFPLNPAYLVREDGVVSRNGKPLRPAPAKRGGYLQVSLWENNRGKTWCVHHVVALTFIGPRPDGCTDCAHGDGNKLNNHWRNLAWKTRAGNEADKIRHGKTNRGERNGQAILGETDVRNIWRRARSGEVQSVIAADYGIDQSTVSSINTGKLWKHLTHEHTHV